MNKFLISLFVSLFAFQINSNAQANFTERGCATNEVNAELIRNQPAYAQKLIQTEELARQYLENRKNQRSAAAGDTITVVFHVIYNAPQENIPDAQLYSQLQILNEDFNRRHADTVNTPAPFRSVAGNPRITFCLASLDPDGNPTTGITRTKTNISSFVATENQMKFSNRGGKDAWMPELYLNIWVCNLGGDVIGFAQFPGGPLNTDGIVVRFSSVGMFPFNPFPGPYTRGRTATHEVGHWLGLRHIWGENDNDCNDSDGIADTPNQGDKSSGCPAFPKVSCNNEPNGDMFMNFMDYTVDNCMNLFTRNQSERLNAILHTSRRTILASNMCSNILNADFRAAPDAVFPGESTDFYYYSNGRRPTSFLWQFEGATPATSTERDPKNIRYENAGSYTVSLTVSDGSTSDTETKIGYLKVTTNKLQVYPNPASSLVTVGGPAGTKLQKVWIYNTSGQLFLEGTTTERTLDLDIRSLRNGLYMVLGKTENGKLLGQRLLIQR